MPLPKKTSDDGSGHVTFEVDLSQDVDLQALKGQKLTATLVSDNGQSETTFRSRLTKPFEPPAKKEAPPMTIKVGDKLPDATFMVMNADGPGKTTTADVFKGKKVALFAVPGAFTPTCQQQHVPGFVARVDELKGKGIDVIACTAVNDIFVMDAVRQGYGSQRARSRCSPTATEISPRSSGSTSTCRASASACARSATRCSSTTASSRC